MNLIPLTLPNKRLVHINPSHIISLATIESMDFETKERFFGTEIKVLEHSAFVVREAVDEIILMGANHE